jgi:hypothetical protein
MRVSLSSHFLLHGVCFFILNPSSTLSYIQVHRYLIGSQRLMASLGNTVKTHGDRRGWGAVGQPLIRRVRSQILLYLIKPMSWVEVYLVLRYVFVRKESALQVNVSFKTPPRENKARSGAEDSVFESCFFIERRGLQECFWATFLMYLLVLSNKCTNCHRFIIIYPTCFGPFRSIIRENVGYYCIQQLHNNT